VRYYDASGRRVGSATTIGKTTNFHGADGRHVATSNTIGTTTRFYGADGRLDWFSEHALDIELRSLVHWGAKKMVPLIY
jgi:hypothetical protein